MSARQGRSRGSEGSIADAGVQGHGGERRQAADQLDYLDDMVCELKEMADRSGHTTLAAILALAHIEAQQRSASLKK